MITFSTLGLSHLLWGIPLGGNKGRDALTKQALLMTVSETWPFVLQQMDYKSSLSTHSNISVSAQKTDALDMNNSSWTINCLWSALGFGATSL